MVEEQFNLYCRILKRVFNFIAKEVSDNARYFWKIKIMPSDAKIKYDDKKLKKVCEYAFLKYGEKKDIVILLLWSTL